MAFFEEESYDAPFRKRLLAARQRAKATGRSKQVVEESLESGDFQKQPQRRRQAIIGRKYLGNNPLKKALGM